MFTGFIAAAFGVLGLAIAATITLMNKPATKGYVSVDAEQIDGRKEL